MATVILRVEMLRKPQMIEFVRTAHGLLFRFQVTPETLLSILILARLWQRLM